MLIVHGILAGVAVATLALGSHRALSTVLAIGAALADLALGAAVEPAVSVMAPLLVFLAAALALAALVAESGLSARLAALLVAAGHGRIATLYALVCAASAALTAAVSLDAAVVVMVPVLDNLRRTARTSFPALFLGAVAVANGASIMVPQGNPTNLVVIGSLRMSPAAFTARMLTPGLAATMICASGVAIRSRRQLGGRYRTA